MIGFIRILLKNDLTLMQKFFNKLKREFDADSSPKS